MPPPTLTSPSGEKVRFFEIVLEAWTDVLRHHFVISDLCPMMVAGSLSCLSRGPGKDKLDGVAQGAGPDEGVCNEAVGMADIGDWSWILLWSGGK